MQPLLVQKIVGILLVLFSTMMLVPVAVGLGYGEHNLQAFLFAFGITCGAGALLRHSRKGDVAMAYSLHRGRAEAIEAIAPR